MRASEKRVSPGGNGTLAVGPVQGDGVAAEVLVDDLEEVVGTEACSGMPCGSSNICIEKAGGTSTVSIGFCCEEE